MAKPKQKCEHAGVQFLFRQYSWSIGGILADDMGLGKTVQTIAFCAALLGKTGTQEDSLPRPSVAGKKQVLPALHLPYMKTVAPAM